MNYFVENVAVFNFPLEKQSDRPIFRVLNRDRPLGHSANKIIKNNEGEIIAVRCNCGEKIYHPAMEDKVFWGAFFSKKEISSFRERNISSHNLLLIVED